MKTIRGICPIVACPFSEDGAVDTDSFQHLVRYLIKSGIRAMTLFGLVTEFYKLTDAERETLMHLMLAETAKSEVAGVISITDHSWEVAERRAQEAEAAGADALMLLPPFFLGVNEATVMTHIRKVLSAVKIPVVVQYAPLQTNVKIDPSLFLALQKEYANLQYVKVETMPPGTYISQLTKGSQGAIRCLVGYAGQQMPDAMDRGAVGVQPSCSCIEPYMEIFRLYDEGQKEAALELHRQLLPYISYWMQGIELLIKTDKILLHKRGLIATNYCRAASYQPDALEMARIDRFLAEFAEYLTPGLG